MLGVVHERRVKRTMSRLQTSRSRLEYVCEVGIAAGAAEVAARSQRGSLRPSLTDRVKELCLVSHNTAVLGKVDASPAGRRTRFRREEMLSRWADAVRPGSLVLVELDRAVAVPGTMPGDCAKLVHLGDALMHRDDLLRLLKKLYDAGAYLVVLFDFKRPIVVTRKTTSEECKQEWRMMLSKEGIQFWERESIGLKTQTVSKCKLLPGDTNVKTYSSTLSREEISPLDSIIACNSAFLAVDVWSLEMRDSLIRALYVDVDGTIGNTAVDYTVVTVNVVCRTEMRLAFLEIVDRNGDPKRDISVRSGRKFSWSTLRSTLVFAVADGRNWHSVRAVPVSPQEYVVRTDVATDESELPFTFSGVSSEKGFFVFVQRSL